MPKKLSEMTAAGTGATIGPIMPAGAEPHRRKLKVDKRKVDEMLRLNPDLKPAHVVVFDQNAHYFIREDFENSARVGDFVVMADLIREEVARQTVRRRMGEVVRRKNGKYVLYAPNIGKKRKPVAVGAFTTKLAAKRAELARFPPRNPEALERLKKQIEKLLKDPEKDGIRKIKKESRSYERDLVERAAMAIYLEHDAKRFIMNEALFNREPEPGEYDEFVKSLSHRAVSGDKGYQRRERNYDQQAKVSMLKTLRHLQKEMGVRIKPGEAKKHVDGKMYTPFSIKTDDGVEVKPIYLYVDGSKVKSEFSDAAKAALTTSNMRDKIISTLSTLGEGPEASDGDLAQARGQRDQYLAKITKFIDNFLANLSPVAMTILKKLWAKKYRRIGKENLIREIHEIEFQVDPMEERELARHGIQARKGMAFIDPRQAQQLMMSIAADRSPTKDVPVSTSIVRMISQKLGQAMPRVEPAGALGGRVSDPTPAQYGASQVPGAASARYAQTEPMEDLMNPEEFEQLYQQTQYQPSSKAKNVFEPSLSREDDLKEIKRLLNRSPWGLLEDFASWGDGINDTGEVDPYLMVAE